MECTIEELDLLISDPIARRELLWLRAKEKDDTWSIMDLQRVDPGIESRIVGVFGELPEAPDFGELHDLCFDWHVERLRASRMG
jgi:hypothetical protein